jgi:hypothetical protein
MRHIARDYLVFWAIIENEKIFLVGLELSVAVCLILLFRYAMRSIQDRRASRMARTAGLVFATQAKGLFARRRLKRLKEKQSFAREVLLIGSTGYRTFVESEGELHHVLQQCREAKIMLLDPSGEGAVTRAMSIADADISAESFREQIMKSIHFLKGLKALQKHITLKLYRDVPFLKLAVLGDYIAIRHYHPGLDVRNMPEYIFKRDHKPGGLYVPLYQYFLSRWHDPEIPEYEFDTDELVYRDRTGQVVRRERFDELPTPC